MNLTSQARQVVATGNLFLDALDDAANATGIRSRIDSVYGTTGDQIARSGSSIDSVYFPTTGVISSVTRMKDGTAIEVAVIGREGFFGLPLALGDPTSASEAMVQISGWMWRMSSADFLAAVHSDVDFERHALRYAQAMLETLAQFSGCNRLHAIDQRFARWLIMAHDRVEGDTMPLTHEYLAMMLGVRRPGVTLAASSLERAGIIEYHRGLIRLLDRAALEAKACECYNVVNDAFVRLLAYEVRKSRRA